MAENPQTFKFYLEKSFNGILKVPLGRRRIPWLVKLGMQDQERTR